jgi:hypothetical protein
MPAGKGQALHIDLPILPRFRHQIRSDAAGIDQGGRSPHGIHNAPFSIGPWELEAIKPAHLPIRVKADDHRIVPSCRDVHTIDHWLGTHNRTYLPPDVHLANEDAMLQRAIKEEEEKAGLKDVPR